MNLDSARVNAALHHKTATMRALGLRQDREDQPPANRVRPAFTTTRNIRDSRTCSCGTLASSFVTRHSISKHSEEV